MTQTALQSEVSVLEQPVPPAFPAGAGPVGSSAPAVAAADVAASASRVPLAMAVGMLFLGALPNGMVTPLLDDLFVQRYGATVAASHWFMAVNLIGAVAIVPVLSRLRRRLPPSVILAGAAVASGILLAMMALPIGFAATLGVRVLEGAADLVMLAVIFDLLGKAGAARRQGARFGAAGTILLLGIASGVLMGGVVGRHDPVMVFVLGSFACFAIAAFALARHAHFDGLVRSCPVVSDSGSLVAANHTRPLWPALLMTAGDRAIAGLAATTLLFYFAHVLDFAPHVRGLLLGGALLMIALGSWPAGLFADRVGHLRVRIAASLAYCVSLAMVPVLAPHGIGAAAIAMLAFGIAGAALMPTSIVLANRSGRGSVAMGAYHASGNIGYHLFGVGGAALMVLILSAGGEPDAATYHAIIYTFAIAYGALATFAALAARK